MFSIIIYIYLSCYFYFAALPMVTEQTGDENFGIFKSVTGLSTYRIMNISEVKTEYSLFFRINALLTSCL